MTDQHKAAMPTAPVVAQFIPTESFEGFRPDSGELLGHYKKGARYHIRQGNQMLADLAKQWESEGKVIVVGG